MEHEFIQRLKNAISYDRLLVLEWDQGGDYYRYDPIPFQWLSLCQLGSIAIWDWLLILKPVWFSVLGVSLS